ncbi:MAG: DUF6468 domain-containing protein [Proteobacteria bacterium]|nr:DUF6468 domain-containing protein [Pseudomonadota bacterium]
MIELMVVGLLCVTIGYCIVLDKRLRAVRADEAMMRKTVVELSGATERAERAIESLRATLGETDRTLAERLRVAERYTADLEDQIRTGDEVLGRISRIVSSAVETPGPAPLAAVAPAPAAPMAQARPASRIRDTLAAAQALAAQAQSRVNVG